MKKYLITVSILCIATLNMHGQEMMTLKPAGENLLKAYLSLNVENLWIAGHHINWVTGMPDRENATEGVSTHCSAFVAAACEIENIYILRPPEHSQILLANAQAQWLPSGIGRSRGWHQITNSSIIAEYFSAQQYANNGFVVVAVCKNPVANLPGHIALVRPNKILAQLLTDEGPSIMMAGTTNHNLISLKLGFKSHIKQWPSADIQFYYNDKSK